MNRSLNCQAGWAFRPRFVMFAVLAAWMAACVPFGGREPAPLPPRVPVEVVNHNPHAASIHRMADGTRTLIGTVESGERAVFEVPFPPSRQLSIEVRLIPVGAYRSWAVVAVPGQVIRVEIPADLHQVRGPAN